MDSYGLFRAAAAVPTVKVADTEYNTAEICRLASEAFEKEVSLVVFPELSVTGCSCGDLFRQSHLLRSAEDGVRRIIEFSRGKRTAIVVGVPVIYRSRLYNCAAVICNGNIKGIVPKTYVPSHETRWFSSGRDFLCADVRNDGGLLSNGKDCFREGFCGEIRYAGQKCNISPNMLFGIGGTTFCVEIGEDMLAPVAPSSLHALQGAQLVAGLSACGETLTTDRSRRRRLRNHTLATISGYIYASAGYGESSQDMVYAGAASVWEDGEAISEGTRYLTEGSLAIADIDIEKLDNLRRSSSTFCNTTPDGNDASAYYRLYNRISLGNPMSSDFSKILYRKIESHPFTPEGDMDYRCSEITAIQVAGLVKRLSHINCRTAILGISGGLDSTLALLVTALAFDRLGWSHDRIVAVTMPGFGTTSRTKNNAWELMKALGVTCREISIVPAVQQHFQDIGHDESQHDATYENSQARERTQILMDIANQMGGIVVGTGDLSELALGWATYNGDHMSMYGVNAGVPKTLIRHLVKWAAENKFSECREILLDIVDTPISPELLPASEDGEIQQVTEDLVGPYELHDFFLYNFMRNGYSPEKIFFLAGKAFQSYDEETIGKWLKIFMRRFFNQQFKRSCLPDGPKIGSVSLSPRGGWSMPSDAWSTLFQ